MTGWEHEMLAELRRIRVAVEKIAGVQGELVDWDGIKHAERHRLAEGVPGAASNIWGLPGFEPGRSKKDTGWVE